MDLKQIKNILKDIQFLNLIKRFTLLYIERDYHNPV